MEFLKEHLNNFDQKLVLTPLVNPRFTVLQLDEIIDL